MNNLAVLKKRIFGVPPSLILIFFFLPWITVSCSGQSSSASGYQLAVEGSGVPGDVRIPILAIGIAAVVALGVAVATNPLSRRFYTGAGLVAGASYLYLLLRFGAFAEEARRQGGTLTLELAVWGVGLAIMSIIGLGALYRPDESKLVSPDPNKAATADSRAQQAQQEKMVQYAIFAVLAVVGGVFLLSLFQSIGADLERRQVISNATATYVVATQQVQSTATANAQFRARVNVLELMRNPSMVSAAFSADGTRLVVAQGKNLFAWDLTTGNWVKLEESPDLRFGSYLGFNDFSISPDGSKIIARAGNGSHLWDAIGGQHLATFENTYNASFSPDSTLILSESVNTRKPRLRLRDTATSEVLREFLLINKTNDLEFSPDGGYVAAVGYPFVSVWETETGVSRVTVVDEDDSWVQLAFSPDSQYIAATSYRGIVILWNIASGERILRSDTPLDKPKIVFSPDSTRLAAGGNGSIRLWDVATGREIATYKAYGIKGFSPDSSLIATSYSIIDINSGEAFDYPGGGGTKTVFWPDGKHMMVVSGYQINVLDIETREIRFSIGSNERWTDRMIEVVFDQSGTHMLLDVEWYNGGRRLELWDFTPIAGSVPQNTPAPTRTPAPTHTPTSTPTSTVTRTPTLTHTPAPPTATLAEADVVATGVAATLAALQAPTQNPTPVIDHTLNCSQSVASLDLRNGASVVAVCPQNCAQSGGTVWGTDIYTHDSSICTAALHSGIAENQPFRIEVLPGQNSYRGSTRNGIQTSSYGSWSLSFRVTVIE